jgi:hypothetical protein
LGNRLRRSKRLVKRKKEGLSAEIAEIMIIQYSEVQILSCIIFEVLYNEELNDLYSSPNIARVIKSRRIRWAGHVARIKERICVYRVLLEKPEGKRPLGRPRRRWEDNTY